MLDYILRILQTYIPIILGIRYVLGYERKKLDNLLKFFIISTHIVLFLNLVEASFQTSLGALVAIPIYIYLTLFNYMYSGVVFDVFFGPLFHIFLEYYYEMKKNVEKERGKARFDQQNGNPHAKSKEGFIQGKLVDIFQPDNIYLLK